MMDVQPIDPPSKKRLLLAAGGAALLASIVLLVAVLPAEYGVDPLGTGERLGLLDLYEAANADAEPPPAEPSTASVKPAVYRTQFIEFKLRPREGFEYKYRVEKGRGFVYTWTATGNVDAEFHGEEDGAPSGTAVSYDKQDAVDHAAGTFTAASGGIHGWYWENLGDTEIAVRLTSAGFYDWADEFRTHFDMEKKRNRVQRTRHELPAAVDGHKVDDPAARP